MADRLKVTVEADDQASKVLDGVADKADKLDGKSAELTITTRDEARAAIDEIQTRLAALDGDTSEVAVTARTEALDDLDKVGDALRKLDGDEVVVLVKANDQASARIDTIDRAIRDLDGADATALLQARDQASGDIERVQTRLRELDGTTARAAVTVDVDTSALDGLVGKLDDLGGGTRLGGLVTALGAGGPAALGAAAIATSLGAAALSAADMAISADDLARLTGTSVEEASRLQGAWLLAGGDAKDLQDVVLQMNGVLQESPELAKQIGVNLKDSIGEQFVQAVQAVGRGMVDATTQSKLFGEEGVRQVNTLVGVVERDLKGAMEDLPDELVKTDDDVAEARKLKTEIQQLKTEWETFAQTVGTPIIQGANWVVEGIRDIKQNFDDLQHEIGYRLRGDNRITVTVNPRLGLDANATVTDMVNEAVGAANAAADRVEIQLETEQFIANTEALVTHEQNIRDAALEVERTVVSAMDAAGASFDEAANHVDAFTTAMGEINAGSELDFSQMAQDTVASFDTVKGSLEGLKQAGVDWGNVDLSPDSLEELKGMPAELGAVTDAVSGMRGTIQTELAAAFKTDGIDGYIAKAGEFRAQIEEQMPAAFMAMGASAGDAARLTQDLLDDLELLPSDVRVQIELDHIKDAQGALEAFSGVIDALPLSKQMDIRAEMQKGNFDAALALLNAELEARGKEPIVLETDLNADGVADGLATLQAQEFQITMDVVAETLDAQGALDGLTAEERHAQVFAVAEVVAAADALGNLTAEERTALINATADTVAAGGDLAAVTDEERTAIINSIAETLVASGDLDAVAAAERAAEIVAAASLGQFNRDIATATAPRDVSITGRYVGTTGVPDSIPIRVRGIMAQALAAGGVAGSYGAVAGENYRPEILEIGSRRMMIASPTIVPPGARVTGEAATAAMIRGAGQAASPAGPVAGSPVTNNFHINATSSEPAAIAEAVDRIMWRARAVPRPSTVGRLD